MRSTVVTLPNGFVSDNGEEIREVEIRQLMGEEEDMILDKEELRKGQILDRLLVRCLVRMGSTTEPHLLSNLYYSNFLLADTMFLLIELRKWGIDNVYRFEHTCPRCERIGNHRIDLRTLRLDQQKDEHRFQAKYVATVIDNDGHSVPFTFRPLYVRDNKMLEVIRLQHKTERGTREMLLQLLDFNGKKPDAELLKKMSWGTRNRIRDVMNAYSGGIDNELLMRCAFCDRTYKDHMPVEVRSFFFPMADLSDTQEAKPFRDSGPTSPSLATDSTGAPAKSESSPSESASGT